MIGQKSITNTNMSDKSFLIIGFNWGKNYAKVLNKLGLKIGAVVTSKPFDFKELGFETAPIVFPNHEAALASNVHFTDAIICTPPHVRSEIASACFIRGLDCIIEKPFALSLEEADSIIKQARLFKRNVFCDFLHLHNDAIHQVLRDKFQFNDLKFLTRSPLPSKFPVIFDWTIHDIYLAVSYFGLPNVVSSYSEDETSKDLYTKLFYSHFTLEIANSVEDSKKLRTITARFKDNDFHYFETPELGRSATIFNHESNQKTSLKFDPTPPLEVFINKYITGLKSDYGLILKSTYLNELAYKSLTLGCPQQIDVEKVLNL